MGRKLIPIGIAAFLLGASMVLILTPSAKAQALGDVDGDGDLDMVFQFEIKDTGIQPGETEACLTGKDINGQDIKGIDAIMTVPN